MLINAHKDMQIQHNTAVSVFCFEIGTYAAVQLGLGKESSSAV